MTTEISHRHGHTLIGGLGRVFHCNHYNAYLQMAVMLSDGVGECQPRVLLRDAVIPLVRRLRKSGYTTKELLNEFSFCGFGKLCALFKGQWATPSSHYGQAALMHGRKECSCYFTSGYIAGMTDDHIVETQCKQVGSPVDWFKPQELQEPVKDYLDRSFGTSPAPPRFQFAGCAAFNTAIDEAAIVEAVSGLALYGKSGPNDTGLIDAFGVVLTNHFADYYNYVSYRTYFDMVAAGMPKQETREVFVQGGHICAFNTFGGIMSSPEWYQLVVPHCRNDSDWIHGIVAVINALGWGVWRVEKIVPGKNLTIRIYNSYEGIGFRRIFARSDERELSFLNIGAVMGLAHLLWKIDIKERPSLTQEFYVNVFNNPQGSFHAEQTHAIAAGDPFDRIVASI
jgi:hypothetical protein